jgi:hypothetical protein
MVSSQYAGLVPQVKSDARAYSQSESFAKDRCAFPAISRAVL